MRSSIFVSIANYRDPQVKNTVRELLLKAKYPKRIHIGVLSQIMEGDEDWALVDHHPNITQHITSYKDSLGACWARHQILMNIYQGEDYYLQIDSHMRFRQNWDTIAIENLQSCSNPDKSIISVYPVGFEIGKPLPTQRYLHMTSNSFVINTQIPILSTIEKPFPLLPEKSQLFAGGFSFGKGSIFATVPYDPYIYFHGEEITMSARLFTHGYDIYNPIDPFVWHLYGSHSTASKHWTDNYDWYSKEETSRARIQHLLQIQTTTNKQALKDIDLYGLGKARPLSAFKKATGIYF